MLCVQIVVSFLEVRVSVGLFLPNLRRGTDTSSQSTFLIQKASALDMTAGPSHKQHTRRADLRCLDLESIWRQSGGVQSRLSPD